MKNVPCTYGKARYSPGVTIYLISCHKVPTITYLYTVDWDDGETFLPWFMPY